jgi:hypothetical protein
LRLRVKLFRPNSQLCRALSKIARPALQRFHHARMP